MSSLKAAGALSTIIFSFRPICAELIGTIYANKFMHNLCRKNLQAVSISAVCKNHKEQHQR